MKPTKFAKPNAGRICQGSARENMQLRINRDRLADRGQKCRRATTAPLLIDEMSLLAGMLSGRTAPVPALGVADKGLTSRCCRSVKAFSSGVSRQQHSRGRPRSVCIKGALWSQSSSRQGSGLCAMSCARQDKECTVGARLDSQRRQLYHTAHEFLRHSRLTSIRDEL